MSTQVPLTREPTCTQAFDPGALWSALTAADTSRPSCSSGHFLNFPWPGFPWLAHGSPLHGDWFSNPTRMLHGSCRRLVLSVLHGPLCDPSFPLAPSCPWPCPRANVPFVTCSRPSSRGYSAPGGLQPLGACPLTLFLLGTVLGAVRFLAASYLGIAALVSSCRARSFLCPALIPCFYPTGPPATLWRRPEVPFCAPCTGCSHPYSRFRFPLALCCFFSCLFFWVLLLCAPRGPSPPPQFPSVCLCRVLWFLFFFVPFSPHARTHCCTGHQLLRRRSDLVSGPPTPMGLSSWRSSAKPGGRSSLASPALRSPPRPSPRCAPLTRPPYCSSPAPCAPQCSSPRQGCISRALKGFSACA